MPTARTAKPRRSRPRRPTLPPRRSAGTPGRDRWLADAGSATSRASNPALPPPGRTRATVTCAIVLQRPHRQDPFEPPRAFADLHPSRPRPRRPGASTHRRWVSQEVSPDNPRHMLDGDLRLSVVGAHHTTVADSRSKNAYRDLLVADNAIACRVSMAHVAAEPAPHCRNLHRSATPPAAPPGAEARRSRPPR